MLCKARPTLVGEHCLPGTGPRVYIFFWFCLYCDCEADIWGQLYLSLEAASPSQRLRSLTVLAPDSASLQRSGTVPHMARASAHRLNLLGPRKRAPKATSKPGWSCQLSDPFGLCGEASAKFK